jgi:hypothetical protein
LTGVHGDAYTCYGRKVPALLPYRIHAIFGPLDLAWGNLKREKELSRLLRLLAIPLYFVVVAAVFHTKPHDGADRVVVLCVAAAVALLLNASSLVCRRYERAMRPDVLRCRKVTMVPAS